MKHPTLRDILDYLDDRLESGSAELLREHLRACAACTREVALQRSIQDVSRRALSASLPADSMDRMLATLTPAMPAKRSERLVEWTAGNVGLGVLLVSALVFTIYVFATTEPVQDSGIVTTVLNETNAYVSSWIETFLSTMKSIVKPVRPESTGSTGAIFLLVLPALLLLFLVDRSVSRLLHRQRPH
ncbi:MAG: hypothetical protein HY962_09085 [Ignavibacteriae bacterium]|nr:hypothetical protein [Ignavibacteriota bacterium]